MLFRSVATGGQPGLAPAGSLPSMPEGMKMVWVKDEKLTVRPVPVTTGIENGSAVEILTGLKEGDNVIISMTSSTKKAASRQNDGPPMPF